MAWERDKEHGYGTEQGTLTGTQNMVANHSTGQGGEGNMLEHMEQGTQLRNAAKEHGLGTE